MGVERGIENQFEWFGGCSHTHAHTLQIKQLMI